MEIALGIVIILFAIFLVVAVLLQSSKDSQLSGAIAGAADTFLGKERGSRLDKLLNKLTPIIGGIFALLVVVMYIFVA